MPANTLGIAGYQEQPNNQAQMMEQVFQSANIMIKAKQFKEELKLRKQMANSEEKKLLLEQEEQQFDKLIKLRPYISSLPADQRQKALQTFLPNLFPNEDAMNASVIAQQEFAKFLTTEEKLPEGFVDVPGKGPMVDPTYQSPYQKMAGDIMQRALAGGDVTGSGESGKGMRLKGLSIGEEGPTVNLEPNVGRDFSDSQLESINKAVDTIGLLSRIQKQLETDKFKTGPFSFRYSQAPFSQKYMGMFGKEGEPAFKSDLIEARSSYATAKTGAQRGFRELQWLSAAMPDPDLPPDKNVEVTNTAMERMTKNLQNILLNAEKAGYDISGFENYLIVEKGGKNWRIVGFDKDGEPLVEEAR